MCFSATASFGASAILGTLGVVAIAKSKTNSQRVFASIPLVFAAQQFSEGLLWLSIKNTNLEGWQSILTYIFLVFAMAVWPFLIPFSIRLMEKDAKRKKIMNVLVAIGAVVAIGVGAILFQYPVEVMTPYCPSCPLSSPSSSVTNHLHYEFTIPPMIKNLIVIFSILYIMATIITPFFSSIKKMKWLGIVFLASYLFAIAFYHGFVISVWCFFAAILSFVVLWIILDLRKNIL
jgi:hypothetical protein